MGRFYNLDLCLLPAGSASSHPASSDASSPSRELCKSRSEIRPMESSQQITIFYNGRVCVCDVTEIQVHFLLSCYRSSKASFLDGRICSASTVQLQNTDPAREEWGESDTVHGKTRDRRTTWSPFIGAILATYDTKHSSPADGAVDEEVFAEVPSEEEESYPVHFVSLHPIAVVAAYLDEKMAFGRSVSSNSFDYYHPTPAASSSAISQKLASDVEPLLRTLLNRTVTSSIKGLENLELGVSCRHSLYKII